MNKRYSKQETYARFYEVCHSLKGSSPMTLRDISHYVGYRLYAGTMNGLIARGMVEVYAYKRVGKKRFVRLYSF